MTPEAWTRGAALLGLLSLLAGCGGKMGADFSTTSGTIETDEAHVASRYGGRVEKIHAREGDALKAGQVLIDLDAAELRARRALAAAQLAELEAGARPEELAAAKADWEAMAAQAAFAVTDARRSEDLLAGSAISAAERDRAVSQRNALEKSAAAAKARYDLLAAGTRPERIAQAKAQLAEIDAQISEMKIVAPADSVLEILSVKPGDVLSPNREVATLLYTSHLWIRVYVPEPWLGHLKPGDPVSLRVSSYPEETFKGEIEQINRAAEFTPRNVQTAEDRIRQVFGVKIRIPNPQERLRPGLSAEAEFPGVPEDLRQRRL